jgi:CRP-like cAMP-binding protein
MTLVAASPAQLLSAIDLFEHIPDAVLDEIASAATLKEFNKDAYLFHQGDAADQFCLLMSGKVKLTQITEE